MGMGTLLMHGYGDASKCMGMGTLLMHVYGDASDAWVWGRF